MKISVYVPNELAEAMDQKGLPVSAICQDALRRAVNSEQPCVTKGCKTSGPKFLVVRETGFNVVTCASHMDEYIGDRADVYAL